MLPADYLSDLADALLEIYEEYQTALIKDMARRIAKLGAMDVNIWQLQMYQEAGGVYDDAMKRLSALTGKAHDTLLEAFEAAGATAVSYDAKVYRAAGLTPIPLSQSPGMLQALLAGLQKTQGVLDNWSLTTAVAGQIQYMDAVNRAYMLVIGGGMSVDQALTNVIRRVGKDGLWVIYHSGRRDRLDVAVRRALVTGVNQTCAKISLQNAAEMGCDLMEVSAHMGARPSHEVWQGGVYRVSTGEFERVTGYGTGAGLCGWQCRHSFYPYYEGISRRMYTDEILREMAGATVVYDGHEISLYDATQIQRAMEREIRALKREWNAVKSAEAADMGTVSYREAYEEVAVRLKEQRAALRKLETQTGLRDQGSRIRVLGFSHSEASTAVWSARRAESAARSFDALVGLKTSAGIKISGKSAYFADQANSRAISADDVRNALIKPLKVDKIRINNYGDRSQEYTGEQGTVVINPDTGMLITAHRTHRKLVEKLTRGEAR